MSPLLDPNWGHDLSSHPEPFYWPIPDRSAIKAILFDLDGVLVDAKEWHYLALNKALNIFGYNLTPEEHETKYNGRPTRVKLEMLGIQSPLSTIIAEMKRHFTAEMVEQFCRPDYAKLMLVKSLRRYYKLGVVTNAEANSAQQMLTRADLYYRLDLVHGGGPNVKPKPDPEMYLFAMEKLGVTPAETVIVEDSVPGLEAAYASGAHVIQVSGYADVDSRLFHVEGLL